MNRRVFLARLGFGTIAAAAAVCAFDVEKLLWNPADKTIFVPEPRIVAPQLVAGDVFTIEGCYATNPITGKATKYLQQFVVAADVQSDSSIVNISPLIGTAVHVPNEMISLIRPLGTFGV